MEKRDYKHEFNPLYIKAIQQSIGNRRQAVFSAMNRHNIPLHNETSQLLALLIMKAFWILVAKMVMY